MKVLLALLFVFTSFLQTGLAQDQFDVPAFLSKAEAASRQYVELFNNLVADETKIIKTFHRDGRLNNERFIRANFIVYRGERATSASEFRSVYEFNGKNVKRSEKDVVKFFEKLSKSDNANEELSRIKSESQRFDGDVRVWGVTLYQNFFLLPEIRADISYVLSGRTTFENREVIEITFSQNKYSPYILSNPTREELAQKQRGFQYDTPMNDSLRPTNPRMNGKLWLDAETGQMWKIEFEVWIQPLGATKKHLVTKSTYEYQSSRFGILTPKKLTINSFRLFGNKAAEIESKPYVVTTLEYTNFESIDANVRDYQVGKP